MHQNRIKNNHKVIFEGAELTGKSFLISQVYDFLEKKYNTHPKILNGCHWFNCDVGIFGSPLGKKIIDEYIKILKILKNKNVIFEKFHLTDIVYNKIYNHKNINYAEEEKELKKLETKIILVTVNDKKIFADRLPDRLKNVPHFQRSAQNPDDYWQMQKLYLEGIQKSRLDHITIDFSTPLDKKFVNKVVKDILQWIGER